MGVDFVMDTATNEEDVTSANHSPDGDEDYVPAEKTRLVTPNVTVKTKPKLFCNECEISFSTTSNLSRHYKKRHGSRVQFYVKEKKPKQKFFCDECEISFSNSSNLSKHNKNKHGRVATKRFQCVLCSELFTSKKLLLAHSTERHEIDFKSETKEFESEEDFLKWKEETEKRDMASYVIYSGTFQKQNGVSVTYYNCHRSGNYEGRGANKRRLKMCGTNKIGKRCPAGMKVTRESNRIVVVYKSTHVGHTKDVYRLRLPKSEKATLVNRMANKVTTDDVIRDIHGTVDTVEPTADEQDLVNIAESYKLHQSTIFDKNDAKSVNILVEKLKRQLDDPVILFKPSGIEEEMFGVSLRADEFLLGIMNHVQRTMLEHHGNKMVYVESTSGMSPSEYQLTTVIVVDDNGDFFPVAFFYASRQDRQTLQLFFTSIKLRLSDGFLLEPTSFMSEDCSTYHDAWATVFKPVQQQLLCAWHVKNAWNKVQCSIPNEKKTVLDTQLDLCLSETDIVTFEARMSECLAIWKQDEHTTVFADYFEQRYLNRKQLWAYCYRINLPDSSRNTALGNWQRDLQLNDDTKKQMTCRLDKSIHVLMAAVRKNLTGGLISTMAEKLSKTMSILQHSHLNSTFITWESVYPVLEVDALKFWTVSSSRTLDGTNGSARYCYDVVVDDIDCKCDIKCFDCDLCIHALKCSCVDNTICHNMCKHIHLIGSNVQFKVVADGGGDDEGNNDMELNKTVVALTDEENKAELMQMIQTVVEEIQKSSSADEYQVIHEALSIIAPTLEAVRSAGADMAISSLMTWEGN